MTGQVRLPAGLPLQGVIPALFIDAQQLQALATEAGGAIGKTDDIV